MKSQDILLLLKLLSLAREASEDAPDSSHTTLNKAKKTQPRLLWRSLEVAEPESIWEPYSMRGLAQATGISKSEVSASLKRSQFSGIVVSDRKTGHPKVNPKALYEFIIYGVKYVFPVKPSALVRGIPTSFAAPVMEGKLMSAGEDIFVWPDDNGLIKGQSITPFYKSVPEAVKRDPFLYELLALIDCVRLGNAREIKVAADMLKSRILG